MACSSWKQCGRDRIQGLLLSIRFYDHSMCRLTMFRSFFLNDLLWKASWGSGIWAAQFCSPSEAKRPHPIVKRSSWRQFNKKNKNRGTKHCSMSFCFAFGSIFGAIWGLPLKLDLTQKTQMNGWMEQNAELMQVLNSIPGSVSSLLGNWCPNLLLQCRIDLINNI